jgi:hypothetical protein
MVCECTSLAKTLNWSELKLWEGDVKRNCLLFWAESQRSSGRVWNCELHPLIHTSAPSESSTKCGSRFFEEKVWIKVCNINFRKTVQTLDREDKWKGQSRSNPALCSVRIKRILVWARSARELTPITLTFQPKEILINSNLLTTVLPDLFCVDITAL